MLFHLLFTTTSKNIYVFPPQLEKLKFRDVKDILSKVTTLENSVPRILTHICLIVKPNYLSIPESTISAKPQVTAIELIP